MMERFHQILADRHGRAQEWNRSGGKVVGFFCNYTPEEVIYAAGALPVRVLSDPEPPSLSDAHFQAFYCPLSRSCLDQGLKGAYDYLDGLVTAYACDHLRGVFNIWRRQKTDLFTEFVDMPSRVDTPAAQEFLTHELARFKEAVAGFTGKVLSDSALNQALDVYETNRSLMRDLYQLRQASPPPISGTEVLEVSLAGMLMPKDEHNQLLRELLELLKGGAGTMASTDGSVRLMVLGSEIDNPRILQLIEGAGATVVADDLCTGSRYFWRKTVREENPLAAIARLYLDKVPCPIKHPPQPRYDHIFEMIDRFQVDGVLILHQKFCDPHEWEYPYLTQTFRQRGILSALIEVDPGASEEEISTQAESLIERIGEAKDGR